MAAKVSDNRGRFEYAARGRLARFAAVATILGMAACGQVLACPVGNVDMYVGRTESEARSKYYGTWTGEECHFWIYLEWSATETEGGAAKDNDFEIKIQKKVGSNWQTIYTETGDDEDDEVDCTSYGCSFAKAWPESVEGVLNVGNNILRATVQRLGTSDVVPCNSLCGVEIVEVEMFFRGYYDDTDKLRDWPAAGSDPRSPKYLFHKENPIYVQVRCLGQDLFTQETSPNAVKVTSDSGGLVYLDLKETSESSQVFRNSLADNGELLYLSYRSLQTLAKDEIKVIDEEVLKFKLRCPLIGAIQSYEDSNDVMVDRAEVGVEWQCDYDTYDPGDPGEPPFGTLDCADDYALGFMQNLGWPEVPLNPYSWWDVFANGDLASQEAHWDSAGDSCYADNVDFAAWCGHGTRAHQLPRILRFFVDLIGGEKQPPDKLAWSEIQWGDEDLDWVVLNTCRFLDGTDAELKQMASGVHLICGYQTDMTVFAAAGEYFADLMDTTGDCVRVAWHQQCQHYQPRGNTARVFGASQCVMDGVRAGAGPIFVSRDPTSSSSYYHWDWTKW